MEKLKKILVLISVFLLLLAGGFSSCINQETLPLGDVYYVVGFDGYYVENIKEGTAKSGGYLLVSEDLKDSLLANNLYKVDGRYVIGSAVGNLLDNIITFPKEVFAGGGCAWAFFPEKYRFAFKVRIESYRPMTEEEEQYVPRRVNTMCKPTFADRGFKNIVITSISKAK